MRFKNVFIIADHQDAIGEYCGGTMALGEKTACVVFGGEAQAKEAASWGMNAVYAYSLGETAMVEDYAETVAGLVQEKQGDLVLCTTTGAGRLLAGKIAAYLGTAVIAGVSAIDSDGIVQKMVYGGAAHRKERLVAGIPVVTLGTSALTIVEKPQKNHGEIFFLEDRPTSSIKRINRKQKEEKVVNLTKAKRIVDVGRGLSDEKDLDMIYDLAKTIDGEVGCSRPIAESNGWMPIGQYIGITGVVTAPDIVVVVGVSGQVQHIVGIDQAKIVVAINKDANALIFDHADFGLVGDMYKILPKLISALNENRS